MKKRLSIMLVIGFFILATGFPVIAADSDSVIINDIWSRFYHNCFSRR
jgi:hypothetical protein